MGTRLFKEDGKRLLYWEGFSRKKQAVFRQGIVGQDSPPRFVKPRPGEKVGQIIRARAATMKRRGFREVPYEDYATVIVQYAIDGFGTEDDLNRRYKVEEVLHDELGVMGAGVADGGDIGSDTMNIYCFVIRPTAVITGLVARLRKEGLLTGAVIAVSAPGGEDDPMVVWPRDFKGHFSEI